MRISIVVPVFEESARLSQLVTSLVRRDDVAEVIIVDASRSIEAAECYVCAGSAMPALVESGARFVGTPDAGRARQMNLGADLASGEVLLFLHADTELPPVDLRRSLAPALPTPGWGWFGVRLDTDSAWARLVAFLMNLRSRASGIATGDQAIFVARALWQAGRGYRDIPLMEDVEICRRLKREARPYRVQAAVITSARRWRQNGVARTIWTMWLLRFRYWLGSDPARLAMVYRNVR